MSYTTLDEYQRKWIFTHQSMPVPEQDWPGINFPECQDSPADYIANQQLPS